MTTANGILDTSAFADILNLPATTDDVIALGKKLKIIVPRARLEIAVVDPEYGYKVDNTFHPLSERFSTLAAAQAVFPAAQDLSECMNFHAIYKARVVGATQKGVYVIIPAGWSVIRPPARVDGSGNATALSFITYQYSDGASVPAPTSTSYPVIMEGAGSLVTHITVDTDRGISPGAYSLFMCGTSPGTPGGLEVGTRYASGASFGGQMRSLSVHGPAANLYTPNYLDAAGCNMNFMCWGAHFGFDDVKVSGFYYGLNVVGDHTEFKGIQIRNCYYGIYVDHNSPYIYGDLHFDGKCAITNCRKACIGIHPGGSIGTWQLSGRLFLGTSPYAFFKEATPAVIPTGWTISPLFCGGLSAEALMMEAIGNSYFWDDNYRVNGAATAGIDKMFAETITFSGWDDRFYITSLPRNMVTAGYFNGGEWRNVTKWAVAGSTLPCFQLAGMNGEFVLDGDIEDLLTQCITGGILPMRIGDGTTGPSYDVNVNRFRLSHTHGDGNCGPWQGRFHPAYSGSQLTKGHALTSLYYGVKIATQTDTGAFIGLSRFTQAAAPTTGNYQAVAVAEEGLSLPVFPGSGGLSPQTPAKLSVTAGCIDTAKSFSDEDVIGYCYTAGRANIYKSARSLYKRTKSYRQFVTPANTTSAYAVPLSDNGKIVRFKANVQELGYTLRADAPVGWETEVVQETTFGIAWSAASGATIETVAGNAVKTGGQGAWFKATCVENNAGLTAAVYSIRGSGLST